jgi:Metallo-beta-lactamase superfamily
MTTHRLINRRMAIAEMGKAGLAVVVFGTAACSDGGADATTTTPGTTPTTSAGPGTTTTAPGSTTTPASTTTSGSASTGAPPTSYQRVNLQFVSAYILYRGGEAALVDTGVGGNAAAIQVALGEVGLDWETIGHVILTHKHPDHVGSVDEVMTQASGATLYAGAADIPEIASATTPQAVATVTTCLGWRSSTALGTPPVTSASSMQRPGSWSPAMPSTGPAVGWVFPTRVSART